MLSWPSYPEWLRDNRWQPLRTLPTDRPVDVFCHGYDRTRDYAEAQTGRRIHGAFWDGEAWSGLPPNVTPKLWADAMPLHRIRALTL